MRNSKVIRLLALVAALALLAAACGDDGGGDGGGDTATDGGTPAEGGEGGDAGEGGASGDPIVIGGIFDLTGATGDVGTPYSEGARDYVSWRNAEGGVGGRPLELTWQDYQYDVAIAEQLYSQFISEGAVAFLGWGTGDTEALRGRIAQDEVPYLSGSLSEELVEPEASPYNFIPVATYSDQMRIGLEHIAAQDPGASVAVFHHDSPFGQSPVADGEAHIEEAGLDLEGYNAYAMPAGATDYSAELTQAVGNGASWVVIQNVASPAAQLVQNIQQQGMDLQVLCLNWCASEILVELAGDAADGVVGVFPFAPPGGEAEGLETPRQYLEEQGGESLDEKGVHYVQGWYTAHVLAEGIANAVESGDEVTGASIRAALEGSTFDTGGVTPTVEFSEDSHRGTRGAALFTVEGGTWTELEAMVTPDVGEEA